MEEIVDYLESNGLTELEVVKSTKEYIAVKFCYDYDKDEISAAEAYSNEEGDCEEGSTEWYENWYLPYLVDIAKDNIQEIVEDICEEFDVDGEFRQIEEYENHIEFFKGLVVFSADSTDIDFEDFPDQ